MPLVHAFCPSCGGNVECTVEMVGNKKQTRCRNCKFMVAEKIVAEPAAAPPMAFNVPDAGAVPPAAPAVEPAAPPRLARQLGTVLSAEDVPAIRNAVQHLLTSRQIAKKVISVEHGFDALIAWHQAQRNGIPIDLVVLDVNMPILDGINAAVCIRAAEKAIGLPPRPILFFTSNLCDEPFLRALEYLAPARYLNKGTGTSGVELGERLVAVLENLLGGG